MSRLAALALMIAIPTATAAPATRIPFVEGLTIVRAISTPEADYESIRTIESVTAKSYYIVTSAEVPDANGKVSELNVEREISAADQREARRMRLYFHTDDPEDFPGTTAGISRAVLLDLKMKGAAELTFLDVGPGIFGSVVKRTMQGSVARVGPVKVPMLVNGRRVELDGLHAQGRVADAIGSEALEFVALDDPDNPLLLKISGPGVTAATTTKIEFPQPQAKSNLEGSLAAGETVEVRSIFFAFASDRIRSQSDRVLKQLADVLSEHPDWKLRIDGHTDSIGNDVANLDLSKRRSAAVRAALAKRYGIDPARLVSDGHGETSPLEKNDTPEGRARNRRVELRRI